MAKVERGSVNEGARQKGGRALKDRVYTVVYMALITAVATTLMTGAKALLKDRIELNEKLRERRSILYGLGLLDPSRKADAKQVDELFRTRVKEEKRAGRRVFLASAEDGKTIRAVGAVFEGQGYWGPIRGILSVDPEGRKIVALYFLSHEETPGLGGRIAAPWFLKQFQGKEVAEPDAEGRYLVFLPEEAEAKGPQEVNAISGATRTSDSMRQIMNGAVKDLREVVEKMK